MVAEGRSVSYAELDAALGTPAATVPAHGTHEFARALWSSWRAGATFVPHDPRTEPPPVSLGLGGDVRTLIFTSGTSGEPKPVGLTEANHEASALGSAWVLGVDPGERWLCCLPLWHVGGHNILVRSAIYGTTAVLHDGFDAERVRAELESGGITLVSLVATMLRRLIDAGLSEWPALRAALVGGGPIPADLVEWATERGFPLLPTYGMTETCSQIVTGRQRLPGVELEIGADGEILVRGPMVAPGAVADDGWLHTRDRGRIDSDGVLHVEGRLDDVIVTGGENVAAVTVEDALLSHPAVSDAAVAGTPDPEWGQAIVAYVVVSGPASDAEILGHCRARLARFQVPKRLVRVDGLPRNAAGKLLRARLPAS